MTASDSSVRQQAIDPTRSFCVSAPAGSGKTELLTQRLLALLARVDKPEQVLAITFTRKAASEMVQRVLEKLDQARQNVPVSAEYELQTRELALAVVDHAARKKWRLDDTTLNIRTIDSFCHELTRQMPILSGTGGVLEPVDNALPLYEEAVRQFLAQAGEGASGEHIIELLRHFDNRWTRASELLVALLGRRGDWADVVNQHHDPEAAEAILADTVSDLTSARLQDAIDCLGSHLDALIPALNEAREHLGKDALAVTTDATSLPDWHAMIGVLLTTQHNWRKPRGINATLGFPPKSEHKRQVGSILEALGDDSWLLQTLIEIRHLPIVAQGGNSWGLIVLISSLLPVLQAHLLLVFQRTGTVDHTHVALAAIQALGSDELPTALAQRLDYQLEHILVDEFQDTSSSQAELLKRLMRGWPEHNATGAAPRTLFIVGDAMQSIYGFRYADVALFLNARQGHFAGITLEPVTLSQNFRSQPRIVEWVNEVFAELMGAEDRPHHGSVRHVKAKSVSGRSPSADAGVKLRLFEDGEGQNEAQFIASQVATVMRKDPEATIAILVRAKSHADAISVALEQAGISFSGDAIQSLAEQPVIGDLLVLCRYLANPADTIAAVSLLRGPWCGVTLNTLTQLLSAHPERPLDLLHALQHLPSVADDEGRRLQRLLAILQWAELKRDRLALSIWVEQIWLRLGGSLSARGQDLLRVEAFLSLLRQAETSGLGLNIDWLQREITRATLESPDTSSLVTIMSLHKAKGLEFDYVFVPYLQKRARILQRELIRWHWHENIKGRRLLIAANDDDKESKTLYNYLNWLQKQKDQEELKRLLYVGVTRARVAAFLTASIAATDEEGTVDGVSGSLWKLLLTSKTAYGQIMRMPVEPQVSPADQGSHDVAEPLRRYRLSLDAQNQPALDDAVVASAEAVGTSIALGAGNRSERIVGVATHRVLELMASNKLPESDQDPRVQRWIQHNLSQYALTPRLLGQAQARVSKLIELTLACETGRWILTARADAKSELAISRVEAGEVKNYVIDRTFLEDREGVRWVIDYKTSEPLDGESTADFLTRESEAYREQLQNYAELVSELRWEHDASIKTALYFPAIQRLSVYE